MPAPPESVVCHVDGYGNVKTSIRHSAFTPESDAVTVELNGESVRPSSGTAVSTFRNGRSIVPGSAGGDDPYQELFLRGGSAASTVRASVHSAQR